MQVTTSNTTMPEIPANLRRTASATKLAPKTASEVPQPKLAHGNTGIHSRTAVMDNAKAAKAVKDAAATKAAPKAAKGKAVAMPATKGKSKVVTAKGKTTVVGKGTAKTYAGKKITVLIKLADCKVRPSSLRYGYIKALLACKTTDDALKVVSSDKIRWCVDNGLISLA